MTDLFQRVRRDPLAAVLSELRGGWQALRDEEGCGLLHEAVAHGRSDVAAELLDRGADPNVQNKQGQTVLHYAAERGLVAIVKVALGKGADPSLVDKYGNSALWVAVMNANQARDLPKLLVRAGANARSKNKAGRSPLDLAESFGEPGAWLVRDLS